VGELLNDFLGNLTALFWETLQQLPGQPDVHQVGIQTRHARCRARELPWMCEGSPLCRHHHRCKQAEGWRLAQPEPGVLVWHTPAGRTYTTTPSVYLV